MAFKNKAQTAIIAGSILGGAALMPVAANASGTLVTLVDSATSSQARVLLGKLAVASYSADSTLLLYRTPVGAQSQAAGTTKIIANIPTAGYKKIRVLADERIGSPTNVRFMVTITEGSELVGHILDFNLTAQSGRSFVLDVPGKAVAIQAQTAAGSGNDAFDFLVYGSK